MTVVSLGLPPLGRSAVGAPGERVGTALPAERPVTGLLVDSHGRRARDLRVSVTDRCNLRCVYCMPAEGLDWTPGPQLLTDDEMVRLIGLAIGDLGITEIRFTGGEPLLRKGLTGLIARVAEMTPRPELSMTTNGIGFDRRAADFVAAGLDRINISLDSLNRETFRRLARRDRLDDVLRALRAAAASGLAPVKINSVLLRGVNDHEAADLLEFSLEHGYQLRFIEQMPLDAGHVWSRERMVTADEIQQRLSDRFTLVPHPGARDGAPAELFDVPGAGTVGIIASVTRPFCGDCDRTRLTADGQMRTCLFARTETDLRGLLRAGASDAELATAWRGAMWGKLPGHGIDDPEFLQPSRPMSAIGG